MTDADVLNPIDDFADATTTDAGGDEDADASAPEGIELSAHAMSATNAVGGTFGLGLDQYELPKASVTKIARSEMPESMQLRKDTVTALVKSSSVFVSYLIAQGNKTISAAHVLSALRELEFPASMRRELREQLDAFRDIQKRNAASRSEAAARSRAAARARAAEKAEAMDVDAAADDAEGNAPAAANGAAEGMQLAESVAADAGGAETPVRAPSTEDRTTPPPAHS
ncbi:DNA-directed DNA polymerase [Malassezia sp. CBS 17886]|nr:DNA-directed DNA polymerase [Malassezia sp. CBS 17886]